MGEAGGTAEEVQGADEAKASGGEHPEGGEYRSPSEDSPHDLTSVTTAARRNMTASALAGTCGSSQQGVYYMTAQELAAWVDEQLMAKYTLDYDRLLYDVRPSLLLLKDLRKNLEDIASLFTHQPKRKLGGLQSALAEGRSVLPYLENAIYITTSLPTLPSLALDSAALASLHGQMQEAIQLTLVNLHTLSHVEIDHHALRNKFVKRARLLNDQLGKLVFAVEQLPKIEQKHALFLAKIDTIKDITSGEIERLLNSHDSIQDAHQTSRSELHYALDKYKLAKRRYEALLANKDVAKARLLEQQSQHALERITRLTQPFIQYAVILKNKKWTLTETPGISKDDITVVSRFLSSATKPMFLDDVIGSPDQYTRVLTILAKEAVSRKNELEGLREYCTNFEADIFRDSLTHWRAATANLYKLLGQGNLKKRFADYKEACQQVINSKGDFDVARKAFEKSLASVFEWFSDWDAVQRSVFDCCLAEFGVPVILVHHDPS